jgi:tight adherence protein B
MNPLLIGIAAFLAVTTLVGAVAMWWRGNPGNRIEDRLDLLTGTGAAAAAKDKLYKQSSVLSRPLDQAPAVLDALMQRLGNWNLLFEQADTSLRMSGLAVISGVLAVAGAAGAILLHMHVALVPLAAIVMGGLPMGWVLYRRSKRLKTFAAQLPDALEMLARGLRAGQSLAFGFNMVGTEMAAPIGKEFSRVFEEQNLGIAMEDSLQSLSLRIPNLDLKFFVTAVVLQRQTGGDLAEILDKIGTLIRDRFRIWGQVQALTGEGRLSGIVLLALPLVLFITVYQLNPKYISMLFTDPLGKKMLAFAVVMQVFGALVIRKIINIKV